MGRGRAKAKQTKVARQLKYSSGGTDLERLQAELAASAASWARATTKATRTTSTPTLPTRTTRTTRPTTGADPGPYPSGAGEHQPVDVDPLARRRALHRDRAGLQRERRQHEDLLLRGCRRSQ